MLKKACTALFIFIFMLMLFLPFLFSDKKGGAISEAERRTLEKFPLLMTEGSLNPDWTLDFEKWLSDNMAFRTPLIKLNAQINYNVFHKFSTPGYCHGKNGSLQFLPLDILETQIHSNLYSPEELQTVIAGFETVGRWLNDQGIPFYYVQCWNKDSIATEQLPDSLRPVGGLSKTDQVVEALMNSSTVKVIPLKEFLLKKNKEYPTYGTWSDPTHWTPLAAHDAYLHILERLNNDIGGFRILTEQDFEVREEDIGDTLNTCIHEADMQKIYTVKNPLAKPAPASEAGDWAGDNRHRFFKNESVSNPAKVLLVGDSYIYGYNLDAFAESFATLNFISADHLEDLQTAVEFFKPDLVILESAERMYRDALIVKLADSLP